MTIHERLRMSQRENREREKEDREARERMSFFFFGWVWRGEMGIRSTPPKKKEFSLSVGSLRKEPTRIGREHVIDINSYYLASGQRKPKKKQKRSKRKKNPSSKNGTVLSYRVSI
jgi:hypothetical protein